MAYTKMVIHAIERDDAKPFPHRFRLFTKREDRDHVLEFMRNNSEASQAGKLRPVKLTILVEDDDIQQLPLEWQAGG